MGAASSVPWRRLEEMRYEARCPGVCSPCAAETQHVPVAGTRPQQFWSGAFDPLDLQSCGQGTGTWTRSATAPRRWNVPALRRNLAVLKSHGLAWHPLLIGALTAACWLWAPTAGAQGRTEPVPPCPQRFFFNDTATT